MKHLPALFAVLFLTSFAFGADKCPDGVCALPAGGTQASYDAAMPVCTIAPVAQAPRLKTLDGKTIAIVGGSFMASVTHPELKRLVLKEFPKARVRSSRTSPPRSRPGGSPTTSSRAIRSTNRRSPPLRPSTGATTSYPPRRMPCTSRT